MSLSATARAPLRVGFPQNDTSSSALLPSRSEQRPSLSAEERAFARRVRPSRWRSCSPAIVTFLFGTALVLMAGAAPPSATLQQMLQAKGDQALAVEPFALAGAEYVLPRHLQWPEWPSAASTPEQNAVLACDPAGPAMGC